MRNGWNVWNVCPIVMITCACRYDVERCPKRLWPEHRKRRRVVENLPILFPHTLVFWGGIKRAVALFDSMPLNRGQTVGRQWCHRQPKMAVAFKNTVQPVVRGAAGPPRCSRADHVDGKDHVADVTGDQATVASRRSALVALVSAAGFFSVPSIARPPGALATPAASTSVATLKTLNGVELANVLAALQDTVPPSKAPVMLRLVFHDGATYRVASKDGGVNGSIQYELDRPESFGLKRMLLSPRLLFPDGGRFKLASRHQP